ncbi:DeoR/GlpR family DNA-binding transcription regulator [Phytoactinopolyspora mesophila]|uniref:DeoR/GlpR family DNA-binding transcription regulator n=1 Tax=Phytoactinopolyspora mesophila TaxID=2650750 RepID=UPI003CCD1B7F
MGVTVVTNSLSIAAELAGSTTVSLRVTGGLSRPASHQLLGPDLIRFLNRISLTVAVVGIDGISIESGLTIGHRDEAVGTAAMMSRAERVIVVADGTKVGRVAAARVCGIAEIDELVTDDSADQRVISDIERRGVRVSTEAARQGHDQNARMCNVDCTPSPHP